MNVFGRRRIIIIKYQLHIVGFSCIFSSSSSSSSSSSYSLTQERLEEQHTRWAFALWTCTTPGQVNWFIHAMQTFSSRRGGGLFRMSLSLSSCPICIYKSVSSFVNFQDSQMNLYPVLLWNNRNTYTRFPSTSLSPSLDSHPGNHKIPHQSLVDHHSLILHHDGPPLFTSTRWPPTTTTLCALHFISSPRRDLIAAFYFLGTNWTR